MLRLPACAALLVLCATAYASETPHSPDLDDLIARQAKRHGVPEKLVRRIVMRESRYNPRARNHSFWGLMQISYPTAKSMGFKGLPSQLLDPVVNLTYAVPYLANAFIVAGRQEDAAVRLYASGYYATAKNRNLLPELRTADSEPLAPDTSFIAATAAPVSTLFSTVVSGPASLPAASAFRPIAGPEAGALPASASGKDDLAPEVTMTAGKNGAEPPKKWLRDGGVTLIAKGEQRVDQVAAFEPASDGERKVPKRNVASRGGKKTSEFAALDPAPSGAQAYAAGAGDGKDIAQVAPQAAIAEATARPDAADPSSTPSTKAPHAKVHGRKVASAKPATVSADPAPPADGAAQSPTETAAADAPPRKAGKARHAGHPAGKAGDVAPAKTEEAEGTPGK